MAEFYKQLTYEIKRYDQWAWQKRAYPIRISCQTDDSSAWRFPYEDKNGYFSGVTRTEIPGGKKLYQEIVRIEIIKSAKMLSEKQLINLSKFLSLVLRHKPETIDIQLDDRGWTDVDVLIEKANDYGIGLDREILTRIVATNSKKRFAFNERMDKIRASQGHSVAIELGYAGQKPPEILYHGTGEKSVSSILDKGLEKRSRQHVHLSSDRETAVNVGQRHGAPFVFSVLAEQMYKDGFLFYFSNNGVWLTEAVPPRYLK